MRYQANGPHCFGYRFAWCVPLSSVCPSSRPGDKLKLVVVVENGRHGGERRERAHTHTHTDGSQSHTLYASAAGCGATSEAVADEGQDALFHGFGHDGLPIAAW